MNKGFPIRDTTNDLKSGEIVMVSLTKKYCVRCRFLYYVKYGVTALVRALEGKEYGKEMEVWVSEIARPDTAGNNKINKSQTQ